MNKHLCNLITCFALLLVGSLAYYLLLTENAWHTSISSVVSYAHSLAIKKHLVVLAILPIYIAFVIFGSAVLGIYFFTRLGRIINSFKCRPSALFSRNPRALKTLRNR